MGESGTGQGTVREFDLDLAGGQTVHAYDTGAAATDRRLPVVWFHGTPNIGAPPTPLFQASERLGIRWIAYDRPGYGGSTRQAGRDVSSAAVHVGAVADALGIGRFAVMSHSGGGPHALACAALMPERVVAAAIVSGLAPYGADGLDWFAGMASSGVASLRAALDGREAKERYERSAPPDDSAFIPADHEALSGEWSWFGPIVRAGLEHGVGGLVDDDLAYVAPWGFEPERVVAPTLLVHGARDRMVPSAHSEWLARQLPAARLRLLPAEGHISALREAPAALRWLTQQSQDGRADQPGAWSAS